MPVKKIGKDSFAKWQVTWKNKWTGVSHLKNFDSEKEAFNFEQARLEILKNEKNVKKSVKKEGYNKDEKITVNSLLDKYFMMASLGEQTKKQSKYHAIHIRNFFGNRQVKLISPEDILDFMGNQLGRGLMQSTVNRRVSILRTAINWAIRFKILSKNPLAELRLPKAKSARINPPTPVECRKILRFASPHIQRLILLGIHTGARIGPSEILRLTWRDIDIQRGIIHMPAARKNSQSEYRNVPIKKELVRILKAWQKKDRNSSQEYVISWKRKRIRSISGAWKNALRRAGVSRRIRPYDLRHAYATYSMEAGADIGTVAEIMGHQDVSMLLNTYQHIMEKQKKMAIEKLPDMLRLGKLSEKEESFPGIENPFFFKKFLKQKNRSSESPHNQGVFHF